jgi:ferrous iron transport protein B
LITVGKQRIGNWPGVTVEKKEGNLVSGDMTVNVVDLPGIYSFSAHSEDERVARDYVLSGEPSMVVNILDATNLERNLYLTVQLLEMQVPVMIILNMMDIAEKKNIKIDVDELQTQLGVPVYGISAVENSDVSLIKDAIVKNIQSAEPSGVFIEYPNEIEDLIGELKPQLKDIAAEIGADERWVAIKCIEADEYVQERVFKGSSLTEDILQQKIEKAEDVLEDSADIILADYRYGFIHSVTRNIVRKKNLKLDVTDKIDRVVLNRILGIPIFLVAMYLVFWVTINIGGAFIDFFDILFGTIFVDGFGVLLGVMGSPEWLISILAGGIGAGIQTVSTFIPIIFTMFFMLSLLEDSGYMARAAFVMDRFMRLIGLPGKSFVPMLVGFGCTVPAVMATRTLENRKDRLLTIFMSPFMSCGARLPVYVLFVAALFTRSSGLVVFSIYMAGIVLAVLTGLLLKKTVFRGEPSHFIMELPPYHFPRLKHIMTHTWNRLKSFVIRAGIVITIAVGLLAFLNSMGSDGTFGNEDSGKSILSKMGRSINVIFEPMGIDEDNWPATVSLFTGLFAKEAVVGTLNSLYSQMDNTPVDVSIMDNKSANGGVDSSGEPGTDINRNGIDLTVDLEADGEFDFWGGIIEAFVTIPGNLFGVLGDLLDPLGLGILGEDNEGVISDEIGADEAVFAAMQRFFTPAQAYVYMLFVLIYFPCLAALGAVVREIGMKLAVIQMTYLTILGWIVAVLFYQLVEAHSLLWIGISIGSAVALVVTFYILGKTSLFSSMLQVKKKGE